jgi:TRAP-type C4-dicarboxylate transport system permease small subunit
MDALARAVDRLCSIAALAGGAVLIVAAAIVAVDVIGRNVLHQPLPDASELSGYALAVGSSWAFGFTLLQRGHIRIDVVYRRLPQITRIVVDLVVLATLIGFLALLVIYAYEAFAYAVRFGTRANTPLGTPMAIPIGLWFAGLVLFLLVAVFLFVRVLVLVSRGRGAEAATIAGPSDLDPELAEFLPTHAADQAPGKAPQ